MVKEDLKLLVVGIGSIGRRHSDVLYTELGCRNITIWDPIPERAKEHAAKYPGMKTVDTFEAGLQQKPDAVFICSPPALHMPQAEAAILAGCHVMVEKPLALNAEDAKEMFAVAKENNVILMEAYAYLHSPYIASLKEDIKSGIIGDVEFVDTAFFTQYYVEDIRMYKDLGGGAVYDLGCYCTTMILSLVDSAPDLVIAKAEFNDKGADVLASVILKFENGARAVFNVGMIFEPGSDRRKDILYVHGSKGTIVSDVEYNQEGRVSYTITSGRKVYTPAINVPHNYMLEAEQLGRCIENGEQQHITPEFSIKNAELLDEILKQIGY